jgi:hypothetical protein
MVEHGADRGAGGRRGLGAVAHRAGRRGDRAAPRRALAGGVGACEQRPDADEHAREVLSRIEPATANALAAGDAGVGLAVCERGWAGLYRVAPG